MRILVVLLLLCSFSHADVCLPEFIHRGDVNKSGGEPNMTDVIALGNMINGGPPVACLEAADVNGDGQISEADVNDLFAYLYIGCGPCMATPHCIVCD